MNVGVERNRQGARSPSTRRTPRQPVPAAESTRPKSVSAEIPPLHPIEPALQRQHAEIHEVVVEAPPPSRPPGPATPRQCGLRRASRVYRLRPHVFQRRPDVDARHDRVNEGGSKLAGRERPIGHCDSSIFSAPRIGRDSAKLAYVCDVQAVIAEPERGRRPANPEPRSRPAGRLPSISVAAPPTATSKKGPAARPAGSTRSRCCRWRPRRRPRPCQVPCCQRLPQSAP